MGRAVFGVIAGLLAGLLPAVTAYAAQAPALPIAKKTLAEKTAVYAIAITYPQTGDAKIDADIRDTVNSIAFTFKKEAVAAHDSEEPRYTLDVDYVIARNDPDVFAVIFNDAWDFHGAHPNLEIVTANYFRGPGPNGSWRVYLPELFDGPRGLTRISALATADLDRRLLGPDGPSDKDWIGRGADAHWENFQAFVLLPGALEIEFPPYAVAAYAAGPQSARIPLRELSDVMRPNPRAPVASFDCRRATSDNERAICSDVTLARLDRGVSETWASQVRNENDPTTKARWKAEQIAWLKARERVCTAPAQRLPCLTGYYKARLGVLENRP